MYYWSRVHCSLHIAKQKSPQFIDERAGVLRLPTWRFWISSTNSEKQTSFSWQYWRHEGCGGASVWGFVGLVWPIFDYEGSKAVKDISSFTISLSLTLRPDYSLCIKGEKTYKTRTNSTKYPWTCLEWKSEPSQYLGPGSIFHRGCKILNSWKMELSQKYSACDSKSLDSAGKSPSFPCSYEGNICSSLSLLHPSLVQWHGEQQAGMSIPAPLLLD